MALYLQCNHHGCHIWRVSRGKQPLLVLLNEPAVSFELRWHAAVRILGFWIIGFMNTRRRAAKERLSEGPQGHVIK